MGTSGDEVPPTGRPFRPEARESPSAIVTTAIMHAAIMDRHVGDHGQACKDQGPRTKDQSCLSRTGTELAAHVGPRKLESSGRIRSVLIRACPRWSIWVEIGFFWQDSVCADTCLSTLVPVHVGRYVPVHVGPNTCLSTLVPRTLVPRWSCRPGKVRHRRGSHRQCVAAVW